MITTTWLELRIMREAGSEMRAVASEATAAESVMAIARRLLGLAALQGQNVTPFYNPNQVECFEQITTLKI